MVTELIGLRSASRDLALVENGIQAAELTSHIETVDPQSIKQTEIVILV